MNLANTVEGTLTTKSARLNDERRLARILVKPSDCSSAAPVGEKFTLASYCDSWSPYCFALVVFTLRIWTSIITSPLALSLARTTRSASATLSGVPSTLML